MSINMIPSPLEFLPGPRRWARIFITKFWARQILEKPTIEELIMREGRYPGGVLRHSPRVRISTKDPRDMRKHGVRLWMEKASRAIGRSREWDRAWKAATAQVAAESLNEELQEQLDEGRIFVPGLNMPARYLRAELRTSVPGIYKLAWKPGTVYLRYPSYRATWPLATER